MTLRKVNLSEKLRSFSETWSPKIVGELNDFQVKLVKLDGEFVWHHHDAEDELFLVLSGEISMRYMDGSDERCEVFGPNEFLIVPHGVEHLPVAAAGTELLLLELKTTVNTGTAGGERTTEPVWI